MFQSRVLKLAKDSASMNDSIHDGDAFIIVFEADDPFVNS